MKHSKTIVAYINAAPPQSRAKLRELHACIRRAAPGAEESIKWGLPAFSYHRILVMFGGFNHHVGFYPTSSAMNAFTKELIKFKTTKTSIQFPLDKPLPVVLIGKITKYRIKESLTEDKTWRTYHKSRKK